MRLSLLIHLTLLTTTYALKGSTRTRARSFGRRTEEVPEIAADETTQDTIDSEADLVAPGSQSSTNKGDKKGNSKNKEKSATKSDDKKSDPNKTSGGNKKEKSRSTKKKCKKAKKTKQQLERRFLQGDASLQSDAGAVDADEAASVAAPPSISPEAIPYCLHGEKTAKVCAALKEGEPIEMEESDKSVSGSLEMDIIHDKSQEELLEKVDQILTEKTLTKYLGCQMTRLLQENEAGEIEEVEEIVELDEADAALSIVGVDFDEVALSADGCSWLTKFKGKDCAQITAQVKIFFDGKEDLTKEEKEDMFDLLISTVESQAEAGDFDEAGRVERVTSESGSSGGPNVGLVAGVVAAAAVVGGGGFAYKRRRTQTAARSSEKGGETSESDEDH